MAIFSCVDLGMNTCNRNALVGGLLHNVGGLSSCAQEWPQPSRRPTFASVQAGPAPNGALTTTTCGCQSSSLLKKLMASWGCREHNLS
jgi:hypothetical protein